MQVIDTEIKDIIYKQPLAQKPVDMQLIDNKLYILCASNELDVFRLDDYVLENQVRFPAQGFSKKLVHVPNTNILLITNVSDKRYFVYDYEKVILAAKEKNKCIEINNHSFAVRKGSKENCRRIAEICRDAGAKIVVSSDAHSCFDVGVMDESIAMLEEIGFPEENIMNLTAEKFLRYLEEWRRER